MHRVFISHTNDSRDYARNLEVALKRFPDFAFVDQSDIGADESNSVSIRTRLQASDTIVVLLTQPAAESPGVLFEIGAAVGLGKRVLPVLMDELDTDKIDYLIRDQQYLDARRLTPTETAQRIRDVTASNK